MINNINKNIKCNRIMINIIKINNKIKIKYNNI